MKQFALGFLIAALLFGGYSAFAEDEKPTEEDSLRAWETMRAHRKEFVDSRNDLAAIDAKSRWKEAHSSWWDIEQVLRGETPHKVSAVTMRLLVARNYEDKMLIARTEVVAKHYLAKYTEAYEAFLRGTVAPNKKPEEK